MTEVTRSPELFLGKRRSAMDESCDEISPDHFNVNNTQRYKVQRGVRPTLKFSNQVLEDPNSQQMKRVRHGEEQQTHTSQCVAAPSSSSASAPVSNNAAEQIQRYHESVVTSLRMEQQMLVARKDQEIQQIMLENQRLNSQCLAMRMEHNQCLEENKLLKKAVAIQDGRFRELSANYDQLQNVMAMAAEHIANLEKNNRELSAQLSNMSYSGSFGHFPPGGPPDVY